MNPKINLNQSTNKLKKVLILIILIILITLLIILSVMLSKFISNPGQQKTATETNILDPGLIDEDGDGIPDNQETNQGTTPTAPAPTDLTNINGDGTQPNTEGLIDSDGDGIPDNQETN